MSKAFPVELKPNRSKWLILLMILLFALLAARPAKGADYSVTVDQNSIRVRLALNFQQNLTALDPGFTLPVISSVLASTNSTKAADTVASAIAPLAPGSSIRDFVMTVRSTPWSDLTSNQWFNLTASFRIVGVDRNTGNFIQVDTGWISFHVTDDITIQGVSVNKIGLRYLADAAQSVLSTRPQAQGGVAVRWEGSLVPPTSVRQVVARTTTLDFSKLAKPISQWDQSLDPKAVSTTFSLDRGTRTVLSLVLTIKETTGEQVQIPYVLVTQLRAEVTAQGLATADGNSLLVDPGTGYQPLLMAAAIGLLAVILVSSFLYERRLRGPAYRRPRRGR